MVFGRGTIAKAFVVGALSAGMLVLGSHDCDAGRGGGRGGGGGGRGGGAHFSGGGSYRGPQVSNGFHHRPPGGGNYHRPGTGLGGGNYVDNSLPGRPGGGGGDHNKPGNGGGNNRPNGGHGNNDNDYYFGWDNPAYGYGVATGLAVGTYVNSLPTNCVYETYGGLTYRRCGDIWYKSQYEDSGVRYVVVKRPY
jgi:hypothetical protein